MTNRRMYSSSVISLPSAKRPEVEVSLMPGILTPIQHATLTAGVWGGGALVLQLIGLVALYLRGTITGIQLPHVAIIFLVATAFWLYRFIKEYRERDTWLRKTYAESPLPPLGMSTEVGRHPASGVAAPIRVAETKVSRSSTSRVVFPAELNITEAQLIRLAVGLVNKQLTWSRRGLSEIFSQEVYPRFCQVLYEQGYLRTDQSGKGYVLTERGWQWVQAVAAEVTTLPHYEGDVAE